MSDYISREAAIAYIREQSEEMGKAFEELGGESGIYADAYNDLAEDFHRIPAADVEPVRHGRWVDYMVRDWRCSECGQKIIKVRNVDGYCYNDKPNYCPNCGAKMDLEEENNDD